ncbi:thiosulfate dehydrogenase [quinone] large subunit [Neolewinella xylanilytica]|uniref:Thiosulfate dehydrogenase [quinone] large subunit n=1 Tax=Neolewinella xylanilytica TaxID=1514080 RepID=A0A2S6I953_9BACT|nr:DoxX family membrane protein [Neolewinella xylanilytica]PPK88037.1 thiosulfate dehydrogenase [quinone] large subunit [Neolewinella xylanilytica]
MTQASAAYALARLPIGFSFFGHGFVRIFKLQAFAESMAGGFEDTLFPTGLALGFAYVLPFLELVLGLSLILGAAMRRSSAAGVALVCILIFGSSFQENWSSIATQMFYGLYLSLLYLFADYNGYAVSPGRNAQRIRPGRGGNGSHPIGRDDNP